MKRRKLHSPIIILLELFLILSGCDRIFRKEGVGDFIGLNFGVPLTLKIKEGPREPPIFHPELVEFYEVDFPNMEFNSVGVAVTKNSTKNTKEGIRFKRENIIWGAMFNNKNACNEENFNKAKNYISKKWRVVPINESKNKPGEPYFVNNTYYSPGVIWELSCGEGLGLSLVIYDYSVLKKEGDSQTRKLFEKQIFELLDVMKRKM